MEKRGALFLNSVDFGLNCKSQKYFFGLKYNIFSTNVRLLLIKKKFLIGGCTVFQKFLLFNIIAYHPRQ
jgi:hypothetical protein